MKSFVFSVLLFGCLVSNCAVTCQRDVVKVIFNNTYEYGKLYELVLNSTVEYILEYEDPLGFYSGSEYPARVFVSSDEANRSFPIFITARQQKGILSWQLPLLVSTATGTQEFMNISRTLCPNTNFYLEERGMCRTLQNDSMNTPILHISTSNPENQAIQIRVDLVDDFYLKIDEELTTTVTPSEPKYYYYSFDRGISEANASISVLKAARKYQCRIELDERDKTYLQKYVEDHNLELKAPDEAFGVASNFSVWDAVVAAVSQSIFPNLLRLDETLSTVRVVTASDDDVCMMVSIQNASCPVFDNEREILYEGHYETVTNKGAITINKNWYPQGFYVIFIVKSSDEDCTGYSDSTNASTFFGWTPFTSDYLFSDKSRTKNLTFRIVPTISYTEYVLATTIFVGSFILIYFVFLFGILCCSRRYNQAYLSMQNGDNQNTRNAEAQVEQQLPNMCGSVTITGTGPDSLIVHRSAGRTADDFPDTQFREFLPPNDFSPDHGDFNVGQNHFTGIVGSSGNETLISTLTSPNGINTENVHVAVDNDSSADTDAQSEYSTLGDINTEKDIYRLPTTVTLAHLAKKGPRVLETRSYLYFWHVMTVAVFYGLPVVQLVFTYQRTLNGSGNQDLCYYNFLCAHPLGLLSDFNHVFSNAGYILLGILFMMLVYRRQMLQRTREISPDCGIPQHYGLFYAMGFALIMEGILSASYHVCPNQTNFQFDTSFMYVMAVLIIVKIYQTRHPDINARAHATFFVLAVIIIMGMIGVMYSNFYLWVAFTALHIFACLALTFQIYYMGRFKLDCKGIFRSIKEWCVVDLRASPRDAMRPKYVARMILIILANFANWGLAAYGMYRHEKDFASHLLQILMGNSILYTFFYIIMKIVHRERIAFYSWIFIASATACWISALYFFGTPSTSWALTPAQSRSYNQQCMLLNFYDPHDIWHALSAGAMFFSFLVLLTLDDGMSRTPRCKIPVF